MSSLSRFRLGQSGQNRLVQLGGKAKKATSLTTRALSNDDDSLATANSLGTLSDYLTLSDSVGGSDSVDYYRFDVAQSDLVSVFFSGLSAGHRLELLSSGGSVLKSSTHSGTTWNSSDSIKTEGTVTDQLTAGTYYVKVTPASVTGNPSYAKSGAYNLNLQRHNAPNTVTVAAQNSQFASSADFRCTGSSDQTVINQAIKQLGQAGGGKVVLMEGTFNISNNVLVTYDNMTMSGVGWSTILRLTPNANLSDAGLLRSAFKSEASNRAKPRFANQHFRHMSLDGNKDQGTDYSDSYGNYGTYIDSSFKDIRIHDFPHYGFDPHENYYTGTPTVRLSITESLADHNAVDGITTDNCLDSRFADNISDSNGRHGINIVTASRNNLFENNIATQNGGNGITLQPGSSNLSRTSDSNQLLNNIASDNYLAGIYTYRASNLLLSGNTVANNRYHGIRLRGVSNSIVESNLSENNSQELNDRYSGIYLDNDGTVFSTQNQVRSNLIRSAGSKRHRHGISEKNTGDDFNTYSNNSISGSVRAPIKLVGPNSRIL